MTAAITLKPLVIPDDQALVPGGASPELMHLLNDIKSRFDTISAYQEPVIPDPPDTTGRLIAGTPLVKNPVALNTSETQAHGLGVIPAVFGYEMECLTADVGYAVGDKIRNPPSSFPVSFYADATYTNLLIGSNIAVVRKDDTLNGIITPGSWKITLTPYKLST